MTVDPKLIRGWTNSMRDALALPAGSAQRDFLASLAREALPELLEAGVGNEIARHIERQRIFSSATFGPHGRAKAITEHIRLELKEIEAAPEDLEEWIDVVILALDGAWRAGHSPDAIAEALKAKQAKNETRTWPDWRNVEDCEPIEHIRTASKDRAAAEKSWDDMIERTKRIARVQMADGEIPNRAGPTFDQRWLRLGSSEEDSGIVLISEIVSVVGFVDPLIGPLPGVEIGLRSGETILAPDAKIGDVKLALMAAES